jgi:hypothetical protein
MMKHKFLIGGLLSKTRSTGYSDPLTTQWLSQPTRFDTRESKPLAYFQTQTKTILLAIHAPCLLKGD